MHASGLPAQAAVRERLLLERHRSELKGTLQFSHKEEGSAAHEVEAVSKVAEE